MRMFERFLMLMLFGAPVALVLLVAFKFSPQPDCSAIQSPILKPFCEVGNEFSGL